MQPQDLPAAPVTPLLLQQCQHRARRRSGERPRGRRRLVALHAPRALGPPRADCAASWPPIDASDSLAHRSSPLRPTVTGAPRRRRTCSQRRRCAGRVWGRRGGNPASPWSGGYCCGAASWRALPANNHTPLLHTLRAGGAGRRPHVHPRRPDAEPACAGRLPTSSAAQAQVQAETSGAPVVYLPCCPGGGGCGPVQACQRASADCAAQLWPAALLARCSGGSAAAPHPPTANRAAWPPPLDALRSCLWTPQCAASTLTATRCSPRPRTRASSRAGRRSARNDTDTPGVPVASPPARAFLWNGTIAALGDLQQQRRRERGSGRSSPLKFRPSAAFLTRPLICICRTGSSSPLQRAFLMHLCGACRVFSPLRPPTRFGHGEGAVRVVQRALLIALLHAVCFFRRHCAHALLSPPLPYLLVPPNCMPCLL